MMHTSMFPAEIQRWTNNKNIALRQNNGYNQAKQKYELTSAEKQHTHTHTSVQYECIQDDGETLIEARNIVFYAETAKRNTKTYCTKCKSIVITYVYTAHYDWFEWSQTIHEMARDWSKESSAAFVHKWIRNWNWNEHTPNKLYNFMIAFSARLARLTGPAHKVCK